MFIISFDIQEDRSQGINSVTPNSRFRMLLKLFGDCVKMCEDFATDFGDKGNGRCITTTHRLTLPLPPQNFFTKIDCHPPPTLLFFVSRFKIKLKGRHFDTTEEIEAESQVVLNTTSRTHLKDERISGKRTTSGVMVASRPKVTFDQMSAAVLKIMDGCLYVINGMFRNIKHQSLFHDE
jgi:hypothetical protein